MAPDPSDARQRREQALLELAARGVNLRRRERLDAIAATAVEALNEVGVDSLLLKGAALAEALYGPDLERGYFDIDLLVSPDARAAARQVLSNLGYTNVNSDRGIADVGNVLHAEAWSRLDPEIGNVMIDLHWRLFGCLAPPEMAWNILNSGGESVTVAGRELRSLGRPALALHTALHLAQHGPDDPKAAADLALAATRWGDQIWRGAAQLAGQLDADEAFAAGLSLLPEGARIADRLGVFPTERTVWDMAHRGLRPRGTHYLGALAQAPTLRARYAVIRQALLPSPAWIRWQMSWASRGPGHLATAYLLHLLRTPVWAVRVLRFARSRPGSRGL
jgi:hypothetical protein